MCHSLVRREAVTATAIIRDKYLELHIGAKVDDAVHGNDIVILVKIVVCLDVNYSETVGCYRHCGLSLRLKHNRLSDSYLVECPPLML